MPSLDPVSQASQDQRTLEAVRGAAGSLTPGR